MGSCSPVPELDGAASVGAGLGPWRGPRFGALLRGHRAAKGLRGGETSRIFAFNVCNCGNLPAPLTNGWICTFVGACGHIGIGSAVDNTLGISNYMTSALSPSDIIALSVGIAQIVVTVSFGLWTVRRTEPSRPKDASSNNNTVRKLLISWLKGARLPFVFFCIGVGAFIYVASIEAPLDRRQVVLLALTSAYSALNLILILGYFFVLYFDHLNTLFLDLAENNNNVFEKQSEINQQLHSAIGSLMESKNASRTPLTDVKNFDEKRPNANID